MSQLKKNKRFIKRNYYQQKITFSWVERILRAMMVYKYNVMVYKYVFFFIKNLVRYSYKKARVLIVLLVGNQKSYMVLLFLRNEPIFRWHEIFQI